MAERVTELRIELPAAELAVLDGYCSATDKHRTAVMREILRQWSERKLHEATLIVRVAGRNPTAPDEDRQ